MEAEEEQDDSDLTFSKHSGNSRQSWFTISSKIKSLFKLKLLFSCFILCPGSVFCVSLDPATNSMAVTGGEDDKAFVWRVSDGEVLLECTGEGKKEKQQLKILEPTLPFQIQRLAPPIGVNPLKNLCSLPTLM